MICFRLAHEKPAAPKCQGSCMPWVGDVLALMQMALRLTPEQKERLLAARTYLLAQMMEIIQERTLIIAMLQVQASSRDMICPPS